MLDRACVIGVPPNGVLTRLDVANTPLTLLLGRTGDDRAAGRGLTHVRRHLELGHLRHVGEPGGMLVQTSDHRHLARVRAASCVWSDGTSSSAEEKIGGPEVDLRSAAPPLHIVMRACSTRLRTAGIGRAHGS